LIIGLAVGVLLLLIGGGVGAWALISGGEESTTASGSGQGGAGTADPKEEAAKDLRHALSLFAPDTVDAYCDALYSFGEGRVFQTKSECTSRVEKFISGIPDTLMKEMRSSSVEVSDLHETQDGTLSVRIGQVYPEGSVLAEYAEKMSTNEVFVLKDITGDNDWRVIGVAFEYNTAGTVPPDAKELMYKG
jgi:hypothetical protein